MSIYLNDTLWFAFVPNMDGIGFFGKVKIENHISMLLKYLLISRTQVDGVKHTQITTRSVLEMRTSANV